MSTDYYEIFTSTITMIITNIIRRRPPGVEEIVPARLIRICCLNFTFCMFTINHLYVNTCMYITYNNKHVYTCNIHLMINITLLI